MSFTSPEQMGSSLLCTTFTHTGYWTKATLEKGGSMEPTEPPLDPPLCSQREGFPSISINDHIQQTYYLLQQKHLQLSTTVFLYSYVSWRIYYSESGSVSGALNSTYTMSCLCSWWLLPYTICPQYTWAVIAISVVSFRPLPMPNYSNTPEQSTFVISCAFYLSQMTIYFDLLDN